MRQGTHLFCMVAEDEKSGILAEFDLYEFETIHDARKLDAVLAEDDGWWVAG
jgi:hypothetical protein